MAAKEKRPLFEQENGNVELAAGGVLGVLAAAEVAASAAVCPLCVIAAPIFLGLGAYKKLKNRGQKTS